MNIKRFRPKWIGCVSFDNGSTLFDMAHGNSLRVVKMRTKERLLPGERMYIRKA